MWWLLSGVSTAYQYSLCRRRRWLDARCPLPVSTIEQCCDCTPCWCVFYSKYAMHIVLSAAPTADVLSDFALIILPISAFWRRLKLLATTRRLIHTCFCASMLTATCNIVLSALLFWHSNSSAPQERQETVFLAMVTPHLLVGFHIRLFKSNWRDKLRPRYLCWSVMFWLLLHPSTDYSEVSHPPSRSVIPRILRLHQQARILYKGWRQGQQLLQKAP